MNKSLDIGDVLTAYRARFDNYPKPLGMLDGGPFKHACNLGATDELMQGMQVALDSGKPMDFQAFARQLNERSVAGSKARRSTSAAAAKV